MAQSFSTLKKRIRSIENTRKVTSAMEMISVAKLNKINSQLFAARAYCEKAGAMLSRLAHAERSLSSNLFFSHKTPTGIICLCVITSDSGLCGAYNNRIVDMAKKFILENGKDKVKLVLIGKAGLKQLNKSGNEIAETFTGFNGKYSQTICNEIKNRLVNMYTTRDVDKVYLIYTKFLNSLLHVPTTEKFLSIEPDKSHDAPSDYIFEPGVGRVVENIIPRYIDSKIRAVLVEAFTSEHAARTVAMKMASDNAKELLAQLILQRNKVRQASITRDLIEIISSAEALKTKR